MSPEFECFFTNALNRQTLLLKVPSKREKYYRELHSNLVIEDFKLYSQHIIRHAFLTPCIYQSYIRYVVRQKRAEIKKALKVYLLYGKTSKIHFQV